MSQSESDLLKQENEVLRERLTRLSEASLRINEPLEFDAVLQGVLDAARSLTDACYGVMAFHDDDAMVQNFLSSGMTAEEASAVWQILTAPGIYERVGGIAGPVRHPDMLGLLSEMGVPGMRLPLPSGTVFSFLASPLLHRDQRLGNIYLAAKRRCPEFTREDEERLVMFTSQASLVIANARRYRDEQRARGNLETLVDTAPVGVVVLDARTGAPVSLNREASRIIDRLRSSDQSVAELAEVMTWIRADGQEVSLRDFPIADRPKVGETIRAEEIVLQVPDGRRVTVLISATPIRSAAGEVESKVVTLQDMTPLEEMERLRADFLGIVSHELRIPLATIKGSTTTLLSGAPDLDPAVMTQFHRIMDQQVDHMQDLIGDLLDVARIEAGALSVDPAPVDLAEIVEEARSRFLGAGGSERLSIELDPELPLVMADRRRIVQVLGNLLTNAVRHSPDGSPVRVSAVRDVSHVAVSVSDQGRGIPADMLPLLFRKFSQVYGVTRNGGGTGSGLGLAICKGIVEAHAGRIRADSEGRGLGARFTFTIPAAEGAEDNAATALAAPVRARRLSRDKLRVLAVDDDPQALRYVRDAISKAGYAPVVTGDPKDVPRLMEEEKPHLVLLDLMLPGSDGIELMTGILRTADVPVIFVSVYGQEDVVARAFDMGASDYVVKPFSPTELAARIRAALRRRAEPDVAEPSGPYELGDLSIDYAGRRVWLTGIPVALTPTEYGLLYELSIHAGRVMTHDHLLQRIWGPGRMGEPWLVREVVKRLRGKLGDVAADPKYILTEPRVGYRMPAGDAG
ncbi:MAG: ATP-binding protein [Chloroflexi bacterium]|nr:ATP-binding protein [Chloroflexota bacterium]